MNEVSLQVDPFSYFFLGTEGVILIEGKDQVYKGLEAYIVGLNIMDPIYEGALREI